jgi:hypothetical protein
VGFEDASHIAAFGQELAGRVDRCVARTSRTGAGKLTGVGVDDVPHSPGSEFVPALLPCPQVQKQAESALSKSGREPVARVPHRGNHTTLKGFLKEAGFGTFSLVVGKMRIKLIEAPHGRFWNSWC